tara:strand:+ start:570 stop:779 length:210 start_codon:yes stop_codon:yes gene_type:complete
MLRDLYKQELYKLEVDGEIVSAMYTGEISAEDEDTYYIFTTLGGGKNIGVLEDNILMNNERVTKISYYR